MTKILNNSYLKISIYYYQNYVLDNFLIIYLLYLLLTLIITDTSIVDFSLATDNPIDTNVAPAGENNVATAPNNANPAEPTLAKRIIDGVQNVAITSTAINAGLKMVQGVPSPIGKVAVATGTAVFASAGVSAGIALSEHVINNVIGNNNGNAQLISSILIPLSSYCWFFHQ